MRGITSSSRICRWKSSTASYCYTLKTLSWSQTTYAARFAPLFSFSTVMLPRPNWRQHSLVHLLVVFLKMMSVLGHSEVGFLNILGRVGSPPKTREILGLCRIGEQADGSWQWMDCPDKRLRTNLNGPRPIDWRTSPWCTNAESGD